MNAEATLATNSVIALGCVMVVASYAHVFSGEAGTYTASRFWVGIPQKTAAALVPLQVAAAVGFLLFVVPITGMVEGQQPRRGLLTYMRGGYAAAAIFAVFFASSSAWPYAARIYLDAHESGDARWWQAALPVAALSAAALSAIAMVAGSFEADMPAYSCVGVVVFASVVVLADAVGWNAKLLHDFSRYGTAG